MVNRVVAHDDLMTEAMAVAGEIAVQSGQALRLTKALLRKGREATMDEVLEATAAMQAIAHLSEDHIEGVAAALEKRPPRF